MLETEKISPENFLKKYFIISIQHEKYFIFQLMETTVEKTTQGDLTVKPVSQGVRKPRTSGSATIKPVVFEGQAAKFFTQHTTKPNTSIVNVKSVSTCSASVRRAFLSSLTPHMHRVKTVIESNFTQLPFLTQSVNIGTHRVDFVPMIRLSPLKTDHASEKKKKSKKHSATYVDLEAFHQGCNQITDLLNLEAPEQEQ